jgi:hypothetical protein
MSVALAASIAPATFRAVNLCIWQRALPLSQRYV